MPPLFPISFLRRVNALVWIPGTTPGTATRRTTSRISDDRGVTFSDRYTHRVTIAFMNIRDPYFNAVADRIGPRRTAIAGLTLCER